MHPLEGDQGVRVWKGLEGTHVENNISEIWKHGCPVLIEKEVSLILVLHPNFEYKKINGVRGMAVIFTEM